jgi:hypothetical protein
MNWNIVYYKQLCCLSETMLAMHTTDQSLSCMPLIQAQHDPQADFQHNSTSPVNRELSQTNRQAGMNDYGMQHNQLEHCVASSLSVEYIPLRLSARNFETPS